MAQAQTCVWVICYGAFHILPLAPFSLVPHPSNRCPRLRLVGVGDIGKSESGTPI